MTSGKAPLVVDASAWTGHRPIEDLAAEVLSRLGARPLLREEAPPLYAASDRLAALAGIAPPRLFFVEEMLDGAAAMAGRPGWVLLTRRVVMAPPRRLLAVLAHEIGHLVEDHSMPSYAPVLRPGAWVAVAAALALGHPGLVLAAVGALVAVWMAERRFFARSEAEADAVAVRLLGTVEPFLHMRDLKDAPHIRWMQRARAWLEGYPLRRPWLDRMAADELADLHRQGANYASP